MLLTSDTMSRIYPHDCFPSNANRLSSESAKTPICLTLCMAFTCFACNFLVVGDNNLALHEGMTE